MAKMSAPTITRPPSTPPMMAGVLFGLPSPLVTCCGVTVGAGEVVDDEEDVEVPPLPGALYPLHVSGTCVVIAVSVHPHSCIVVMRPAVVYTKSN